MKRRIVITFVLGMTIFNVVAQECQIMDSKQGSITFVVDENLPKPKFDLRTSSNATGMTNILLSAFGIEKNIGNVLACSYENEKIYLSIENALFHSCYLAYADHRPLVLSPDAIWLNICQTFAEYDRDYSKKMRPTMMKKGETMDIEVEASFPNQPDWNSILNILCDEVDKRIKSNIAQIISADFSTTGLNECLATTTTLMKAEKPEYHKTLVTLCCGIPYITLQGTPADWKKIVRKTALLKKYGMGWWVDELQPILNEFQHTAEGHPNQQFWKDIVMKYRPDSIRIGVCSKEQPTYLDGWIIKLFPRLETNMVYEKISPIADFRTKLSHVKFKYRHIPHTGDSVEVTDVDLYTGFLGIDVDSITGALTPRMGWLARSRDPEAEEAERLLQTYGQPLIVKEVPKELKRKRHIKELHLQFEDDVVVPAWMDSIQIDRFTVSGVMSDKEKAVLSKRFPKAKIIQMISYDTRKRNIPAGQYTYRLDSIVCTSANAIRREYYRYDASGKIVEVLEHRTFLPSNKTADSRTTFEYDANGFNTTCNHYKWVDGVEKLVEQECAVYSADGGLLVKESKKSNNYTLERYNYEYNKAGDLVSKQSYHLNINIAYEDTLDYELKKEYTYDKKHRMTSEITYMDRGRWMPFVKIVYEYDKTGELCHETHYDYKATNWQKTKEKETKNQNRSYDKYGNLIREDEEDNHHYYGSTNYYYDLATPLSQVQGMTALEKSKKTFFETTLLSKITDCKHRLMRMTTTNADGQLRPSQTQCQDIIFYYSPVE